MKRNFKSFLATTGQSALLVLPATLYAAPSASPCDAPFNKNAIHCAYIAASTQPITGKYIKIKESQKGHPSTTQIFCVAPSSHALKTIPQTLWGTHQSGKNLNWQFSQCIDEDCSTSKLLADDSFTVTKTGTVYTSAPKNAIEVMLDPNYGVDCTVTKRNLLNDFTLQAKIDDASAMLEAVPGAFSQTLSILQNMESIANDAASGSHTRGELKKLDKKFQQYKNDMDAAQQVNTLDGYKKIGNGTLNIQLGINSPYSDYLEIGIPAISQQALGVDTLDVKTVDHASQALNTLYYAEYTVEGALPLKK